MYHFAENTIMTEGQVLTVKLSNVVLEERQT